jgi:hypothetical protein
MAAKRRKVGDPEKQALADRLRAIMAAYGLSERAVASAVTSADQSAISRFLSRDYTFETAKTAAIIAYVKMQETESDPEQLELPFETRIAMNRFLKANGDIALLNSLIDVLTVRTGR